MSPHDGAHGGTLAVESLPQAVPPARHALLAALGRAGVAEPVAADAALALTELLANAIRHGSPRAEGSVAVSWEVDEESVAVEVRDGGPARPPAAAGPPPAVPRDAGGRGLVLVRALGDLTLTRGLGGTTARVVIRR